MQSSCRIMHKWAKLKSFLIRNKLINLILCGMIFTQVGYPLPNDREKPAELSADSAILDQQGHYGEYIGHVDFLQGTTGLKAEKAITKGDEHNKLVEAVAIGSKKEQAHYWMLPGLNQPLFHAYADTIRYYPDKHIVELIGNARIIQGKNSFASDKIVYDIVKQQLISKGNKENRTTIIIHPDKTGTMKNPLAEIKP